MSRFTCPECGTLLKDRDALAADAHGRCEECGCTLPEEEAQVERKPRKKRKKMPRGLVVFCVLLVTGGLLLIVGGTITVILILRGGGNNLLGFNTGANPKLTEANLHKLWAAMSRDQAQAILGDGKPCETEEINKICNSRFDANHQGMGLAVMVSGQTCGVQSWHYWHNGGLLAFAGFHDSKSGIPRLVVLRWFRQHANGGFDWAEAITLLSNLHPEPDSLDRMADRHEEEVKLLDDPKWKKGGAIRKTLVGRWRLPSFDPVNFPSTEGFDFNADGSCVHIDGPGGRHPGNYRFVDEKHIEITTTDELMAVGGGKRPWTRRYRVLVNDKELILVRETPSGPSLDMTLERK